MTSTRSRDGKCSRNVSSTGTDTLYGRFATRAVGARPGRARTSSASPRTTVSDGCGGGPGSGAPAAGTGTSGRSSVSTATTSAPASSRPSVSEPSPGPTSTTRSPATTSACRTILRTVPPSRTKFCPRVLVGRMPARPARARISAGPSNGPAAGATGPLLEDMRASLPGCPRVRRQLNRRDPQTGHWPAPERLYSICARAVCSSAEACEGSPEPPTAFHVATENWYSPWYLPDAETIDGLPPDSHAASAAQFRPAASPPPTAGVPADAAADDEDVAFGVVATGFFLVPTLVTWSTGAWVTASDSVSRPVSWPSTVVTRSTTVRTPTTPAVVTLESPTYSDASFCSTALNGTSCVVVTSWITTRLTTTVTVSPARCTLTRSSGWSVTPRASSASATVVLPSGTGCVAPSICTAAAPSRVRSSDRSGRPPAAERDATRRTSSPRVASMVSASSAVSAVVQTVCSAPSALMVTWWACRTTTSTPSWSAPEGVTESREPSSSFCSASRPSTLPENVDTVVVTPSTSRVTVLWASATATPPVASTTTAVAAPMRRTRPRRDRRSPSGSVPADPGSVLWTTRVRRAEGVAARRARARRRREVTWFQTTAVPGTGGGCGARGRRPPVPRAVSAPRLP